MVPPELKHESAGDRVSGGIGTTLRYKLGPQLLLGAELLPSAACLLPLQSEGLSLSPLSSPLLSFLSFSMACFPLTPLSLIFFSASA